MVYHRSGVWGGWMDVSLWGVGLVDRSGSGIKRFSLLLPRHPGSGDYSRVIYA